MAELADQRVIEQLDAERAAHRRRYAVVLSTVLAIVTLAQSIGFIATGQYWLTTAIFAALSVASFIGLAQARRGQVTLAIYIQLVALCLVALGAVASNLRPGSHYAGATAYFIVIVIAGNMLGARACRWMTLVSLACVTALILLSHLSGRPEQRVYATQVSSVYLSLLIVAVAVARFGERARRTEQVLRQRIGEMDRWIGRARVIATGDLAPRPGDDAITEQMVQGLRGIVQQVRTVASEVVAAAEELSATARGQERSARDQASAADRSRGTMDALWQGAGEIAGSAAGVSRSAEAAAENASVVESRISQLDAAVQRIAEVLSTIHDIASQSEVLALNAALEAIRAGGAGRSFALVADRMQRLAETTKTRIEEINRLVVQIDQSRVETVAAASKSREMVVSVSRAAIEIGGVARRQREGTEEALEGMAQIGEAAQIAAIGTSEALRASTELARVASQLDQLVERFRL